MIPAMFLHHQDMNEGTIKMPEPSEPSTERLASKGDDAARLILVLPRARGCGTKVALALSAKGQMMGIILRWFGAFALLSVTFNPTDVNFMRWADANWQTQMPLTVLLGLLLAVAYIIYIGATLRSLGAFGMILITAVFGALIWVLVDWGLLAVGNSSLNIWLGILALSLVLGIGLSWSILWQRMSGQATVDDVED
jgi:hypothetical protein